MKTVLLAHGIKAQVDDADYVEVSRFSWSAKVDRHTGRMYARAHIPGSGKRGGEVLMHRLIMGPITGEKVDHRDGDGLNNQRFNLRKCTHSQNLCNSRNSKAGKTSKYKGVSGLPDGRFYAQIMYAGKKKNLGRFRSELDAARAYDLAARSLHGEFAVLNLVDG